MINHISPSSHSARRIICVGKMTGTSGISNFTSQYVYDELESLVSLAREEINQARPQDWQLEKLLELFYGEWGFCFSSCQSCGRA